MAVIMVWDGLTVVEKNNVRYELHSDTEHNHGAINKTRRANFRIVGR